MACRVLNSRVLIASFINGLSLATFRCYSSARRSMVGGKLGAARSRPDMVERVKERAPTKEEVEACSAWLPDPVTGYYRPDNSTQEIDPVELREMLLNNKVKSN